LKHPARFKLVGDRELLRIYFLKPGNIGNFIANEFERGGTGQKSSPSPHSIQES
jgi:hypothetical protein